MVLEVNLNHFVGETEHNSVSCTHPLLHVHKISNLALAGDYLLSLLVRFRLGRSLKVRSKMLQQSHFLLKSRGVVNNRVLFADILAVTCTSLNIVEVEGVRVQDNLGSIVEEYTD